MNEHLLASVFFSLYVIIVLSSNELEYYAVFICIIATLGVYYMDKDTKLSAELEKVSEELHGNRSRGGDIIKFGACLPLHTSKGINIMNGIKSAFVSRNINGGINSQNIDLLVLDTYESIEKTKHNAIELMKSNVLGIVSPIGKESTDIILENTEYIPVISPFTMNSSMRDSDNEHYNRIYNICMFNYDIFKYMTGYFTDVLQIRTYGVFYENSAEHENNVEALEYILSTKKLGLSSKGMYNALTPNSIKDGLNDSINSSPKVIFVISDLDHVIVKYIKDCRDSGMTSLIAIISLHAREIVDKIPNEYRYNIYYCSNLPDLDNLKLEIATNFKRDILLVESFEDNAINSEKLLIRKNMYDSFYGYMLGKYIIDVLDDIVKAKQQISIDTFNLALHSKGVVSINDYIIEFFNNTNQSITYMFMYEVHNDVVLDIKYTPDVYIQNSSGEFNIG